VFFLGGGGEAKPHTHTHTKKKMSLRAKRDRKGAAPEERNAIELFNLVKKQKFPLSQLVIDAEFNCYSSPDFSASRFGFGNGFGHDFNAQVVDFLRAHPVPPMQISLDTKREVQWAWTKVQGAREIKKTQLSHKPVMHFAYFPATGEVTGMVSNTLQCSLDKGSGVFRTKDTIKDAVAPPFFAGEYVCVQSSDRIRVTNRSDEFASINTVRDKVPMDLRYITPTSVIGFHVWDQSNLIVVAKTEYGTNIYTINTVTRQVKTQIFDFAADQTQVTTLFGEKGKSLFLQFGQRFYECTTGPNGFSKVRVINTISPKQYMPRPTCFCINTQTLCVGSDSFVSFYNVSHPVREMEADFYVTCNKPRELFFTGEDILVSGEDGVQLWTF